MTNTRVTVADGYAERNTALAMLSDLPTRRITLGGDKGYDSADFILVLCVMEVTPHVAQNTVNGAVRSMRARRGTRAMQPTQAQNKSRKAFGWMKTIGLPRKLRHPGRRKIVWIFRLAAAAYNLIRIRNLVHASV